MESYAKGPVLQVEVMEWTIEEGALEGKIWLADGAMTIPLWATDTEGFLSCFQF